MRTPPADSYYKILLLALAGFGVVLQIAAMGTLRGSLWGFHLFAFLPPYAGPIAWGVLAVAAVFMLRAPGKAMGGNRVAELLARRPVFSALVLAAICTTLFWVLRSEQILLGDALPLTVDLPEGKAFHPRQPFAMWLAQALYRSSGHLFARGAHDPSQIARDTVALGSTVAGFLFVLTVVALGHRIVRGSRHAKSMPWLVALILLCQGYAVLFFGYIENYTSYTLFIAIYLLTAVLYLERRLPLAVVAIVFVASMGLHLSSYALAPSLLFLAGWGLRRRDARRDAVVGIAALAVGLYLLSFVLRLMQPGYDLMDGIRQITSVARTTQGGGAGFSYLFTWMHIRDFANEQYLLGPLAAYLFVPALVLAIIGRNVRTATAVFLTLAAGFYLAGSWMMSEPLLGYARDWDLFAPAGVCYTAAGLYFMTHQVKAVAGAERLLRFALVLSLLHLAPWVWINHSEARTLERVKELPLGKGRTEVVVGNYYLRAGRSAEAQEWFARALQDHPNNVNAAALLGRLYAERADFERATEFFDRAVTLRPDKQQFRANLVSTLLELRRCDQALPHMVWLAEQAPQRLNYWQQQGDILLRLQCTEALKQVYAPVVRYVELYLIENPDDEVYTINAGIFLGKLDRLEESLVRFQSAQQIQPDLPSGLFYLGFTLARMGRNAEAVPYLERFLRLYPDHPLAGKAREILAQIQ